MKRAVATLSALLVLAPAPARAGVEGDGVIVSAVVLGSLAGAANTVAALVYGLDQRAFDVPWVVSSMFSTAICGGLTVSFVVDLAGGADPGLVIGILFFGALAAIPGYWTVRSALAESDPGERFDGPTLEAQTVQRPEARDPMGTLLPAANPSGPALIVPLGFRF